MLIISVVFIFCVAGIGFAAYEFYGIITNITGQEYTIRADNGETKTFKGTGTKKLKIGDRVNVNNGMIILQETPLNPKIKPPRKVLRPSEIK
jgi:hypothetical protein